MSARRIVVTIVVAGVVSFGVCLALGFALGRENFGIGWGCVVGAVVGQAAYWTERLTRAGS